MLPRQRDERERANNEGAGAGERCWVSTPHPSGPHHLRFLSPWALPLQSPVTCGNGQAPLWAPGRLPESLHSRVEPEGWSPSPHTQPSFHHLPFIQRLAYPNFFFFFLLPLQWKALHAQPNKVLRPPHPLLPQIPAKKKKEGRLKPGTHLAKGTLVNKKVTHHELQVTPRVILNPLPGDLAQAEFDFMNCEVAMLKVCKLDINWTQKTGGAEWFSF